MSGSPQAASDKLCLSFAFLQPKTLQLLKANGYDLQKVNYRRPLHLYEVSKAQQPKGYIGFLQGYGFQTLWVVLSELQVWGIQKVFMVGVGGHTFEAPKGACYWITQAHYQKAFDQKDCFSEPVTPNKPLDLQLTDLPQTSAVSLFTPYETCELLTQQPIMVDMETGWLFEGCNRLGLSCGAVLMAYDHISKKEYKSRIHARIEQPVGHTLKRLFDKFFA